MASAGSAAEETVAGGVATGTATVTTSPGGDAFLARERSRRAVPGMPELDREITEKHRDVFVVYLSTGAWNTAVPLTAFLIVTGAGLVYGYASSTRWNTALEQKLYDEPIVYAQTTK